MAYQYHYQPQSQVHPYPLLDQQYNPTETLRSFTNAVFDYLDMHQEPKGTQLLEPAKMKTLLSYLVPKEHIGVLKISNLAFYATFSAFKIETVFTATGPAVTRAGLVTYFRSEMMGDPDACLRNFNAANQVMRLGPPFERSQLPQAPEPGAKQLISYVQASISGTIKDMGWSPSAAEDEQLEALKVRHAIEAMGQQAALDLISSNVCYRCRRYPCVCI
ncbi:hypothetical protein BGZ79_004810 [Entomortierella chlamydospora]|nr:hypothetical protein BGZ79_004810 [Entomortierella chlamydospora]